MNIVMNEIRSQIKDKTIRDEVNVIESDYDLIQYLLLCPELGILTVTFVEVKVESRTNYFEKSFVEKVMREVDHDFTIVDNKICFRRKDKNESL